jgi:hypothetical protein
VLPAMVEWEHEGNSYHCCMLIIKSLIAMSHHNQKRLMLY